MRETSTTSELKIDPSSIEQLRQLTHGSKPTFHTFSYRGEYILYIIPKGIILKVDSGMHALFDGIRSGLPGEEIAATLDSLGSNPVELLSLAESLALEGLFEEENDDPDWMRERKINSYLNHKPRKMMLLVQSSCNLACTYCYEGDSGFHFTGKGKMTLEKAKQSIHSLIERSGNRPDLEITFFGGEPLLNFSLIKEVVEYCNRIGPEHSKAFHYSITTNATLLTEEVADYLIENTFTTMVSLDGPPESADTARVDRLGRGTTEKAALNAKRLVEKQLAAGIRPALIRATLSKENKDSDAVETYFKEMGFPRTMIGSASGRAHAKGPSDLTSEDSKECQTALDEYIEEYYQWLNGNGPKPAGSGMERTFGHLEERLKQGPSRGMVSCGVGRNMLAYTESGDIYPCHRYAGEEEYKVGHVESGLDKNRLSEFYGDILSVYDNHCSKCWARTVCGGQCAHYVSRPNGRVDVPDKEGCDQLRLSFEKRLWLFCEVQSRTPESKS